MTFDNVALAPASYDIDNAIGSNKLKLSSLIKVIQGEIFSNESKEERSQPPAESIKLAKIYRAEHT